MNLFTAKTRIAFGLACLLLSVLCTAMMLGIVPERRSAILAGRASLCETVAMTSSDYISRGEMRRLQFFLESVVGRNDEILSAGVRRTDGELAMTVGDHAAMWKSVSHERSTDAQVHVPIRSGQEKWGAVELRYRPLSKSGLAGWIESPWLQMAAFVAGASYLLFLIYLRKMLAHLDPSKTVPRRVRSALDSLAEGLLVIDRNQRIVLANQSFATWVDRDPDKLIGVHAAKLDWVKNEQADPLDEFPWVEAIRLEAPQAGVMLGMKRKDDPIRILIANASPVLGHDGKYRGVLVSFDDVTQLEETKRDLQVAKQIADEANQAKSEFLARMSHEIRTPMNAILGYTDVLRRGFDESVENRQEYLDTIHSSGEHLLALINDILDLSKVEAGQMELELDRCSPHKIVGQVVTLLRSKADERGISLEFKCDGLLPETILTDSVRLRQTIMNLAGNAIKFTETGGVTIAARLVGKAAGGRRKHGADPASSRLAVDVSDTGIGIPKTVQDKIFKPFAQADSSVTRKFGGTGLGLAISKQLAEAMGGGIEVTSKEGKGSTFTVIVDTGPLDGIEMVDGKEALATVAKQKSEREDVIQLPPAKILVADDGDSNRKLLELVLRRAGIDVVSVENGELALERALESPFDAILMDMQMPVMDGYTAATSLREAGYELPIIALTAHAMRGDEEKCRAAGCSGFLTKPINIDGLLTALRELLESRDTDRPSNPVAASVQVACAGTRAAAGLPTEPPGLAEGISRGSGDATSQSVVAAPSEPIDWEPSDPVDSAPPESTSNSLSFAEDIEYHEILLDFIKLMQDQVNDMHDAMRRKSFSTVASLAHSLRGAAGTFGFHGVTEPAAQLEQLAEEERIDVLQEVLAELTRVTDGIVSTHVSPAQTDLSHSTGAFGGGISVGLQPSREDVSAGSAEPLVSSLPTDDAEFREIVEEFVQRLFEKIEAMEQAWQNRDFDELAALAHWLKGSGGTAGFDAFTTPAKALEQMSEQHNGELTPVAINDLRRLTERIVVPAAL